MRRFDRRRVAELVAEEIRSGPASGEHWANVEAVANRIGEINLGLEAARRYALTEPRSLARALHYCNALAMRGRIESCLQETDALPAPAQDHPEVLHLRSSLALRMGEFERAAELARRALARAPQAGQYWLALSLAHKFSAGDAAFARLQAMVPQMAGTAPESHAAFCYALGKARHDSGDYDGAFAAYEEGAAKLRGRYDARAMETFVRDVIRDFTPENLARLVPSDCDSDRALFVTGIPRSGTTLAEHILTSHSAVADGEEVNLFCTALIPAGDFSFQGALDCQQRAPAEADPWGDIGRDYLSMLDQRFGPRSGEGGRIVDKTLNHSAFMGLLLHTLPRARVIWMRRNPEDTAISCFRSFFGTGTVPWCWSLQDIGRHLRLEDALYAHWTRVFPDRILTVPYEALVADPRPWITKMLAHVGLEPEPAVFAPHLQKRPVLTASVTQVREPIGTASVGAAHKYRAHLQPFRDAYAG